MGDAKPRAEAIRPRARVLAVVIAALMFVTGCSGTMHASDDVFRMVVRNGDDVARASAGFDDFARVARRSDQADDLLRRAEEAARRARAAAAQEQVREATAQLAWSVTCDVAFDQVPADRESLMVWASQRALDFGLAFASDEDLQQFVSFVMASTSTPDQKAHYAHQCQQALGG